MPPSPGSYGSNSGPPHHHPMGPPPHHPGMGPPPPTMGPPPPNSHHEAPMPPPSSTPNSHPAMPHSEISSDMHDNGITTTASGKKVLYLIFFSILVLVLIFSGLCFSLSTFMLDFNFGDAVMKIKESFSKFFLNGN